MICHTVIYIWSQKKKKAVVQELVATEYRGICRYSHINFIYPRKSKITKLQLNIQYFTKKNTYSNEGPNTHSQVRVIIATDKILPFYTACGLSIIPFPYFRFLLSISFLVCFNKSLAVLPRFVFVVGWHSNILLCHRLYFILLTCPYHFKRLSSILSSFLVTLLFISIILLISSFVTLYSIDTPQILK